MCEFFEKLRTLLGCAGTKENMISENGMLTMNILSNDSNDSVVLIYSSDDKNKTIGTGFLIHKKGDLSYVLTCSHVVRDMGQEEQVRAWGKPVTVVASGGEFGFDLAVLEVKGLSDRPTLGLRLCTADEQKGKFIIPGVYEYAKNYLRQEVSGKLVIKSPILSKNPPDQVDGWKLNIEEESGLEPGYSGSPIIEAISGDVLGVVICRKGSQEGLVISIEALKKVWKDMPEKLILPPSISNGVPPNTNGSSDKNRANKDINDIVKAFTKGNIVPFIGPGVNPIIYIDLASKLMKEVGKDLFYEEWKSDDEQPEINSIKKLIKTVIGLPCSACHHLMEERLDVDCPMLETIIQRRQPEEDPLYKEQELVIAKMNIRSLAEYLRFGQREDDLYEQLRPLPGYMNAPSPNDLTHILDKPNNNERQIDLRIHQFLADLPKKMEVKGRGLPYKLIITTNYDDWLENVFDNLGQPFDVIYYITDMTAEKNNSHFMYRPHGQTTAEPLTDSDQLNSGEARPTILKLYGVWDQSFVITERHFNRLLTFFEKLSLSTEGPLLKISNIINDNYLVFMGYSPSDPELQRLLDAMIEGKIIKPVDERDKEKNKEGKKRKRQPEDPRMIGWLIHQCEPGEIENNIWNRRRTIKLVKISNSLSDFVFNVLRKNIYERIGYQEETENV